MLKASITTRDNASWSHVLSSFCLIVIQLHAKSLLSVLGDMILDKRDELAETELLRLAQGTVLKLKSAPTSCHAQPAVYTPKELEFCTYVLHETDGTRMKRRAYFDVRQLTMAPGFSR